MAGDEVADSRRRPACDLFDIVREPVVTIRGMQLGHRHDMSKRMLRQTTAAKRVAPPAEGHVDIADRATEGGREFRGHRIHVLRLWPGQLVNLADVPGRTCENR